MTYRSNTAFSIPATLAILGLVLFTIHRRNPGFVQAAETAKTVIHITFGVDGAKDVDWSGTISPAPARLSGWQFDSQDGIDGNRWKCTAREETYWDTPYERSMGPTSNRDKVTRKGVLAEFDVPLSGDIQVETKQGRFSFTVDSSLWTGPRVFLGNRVEVRSAPLAAALSPRPGVEDYPALLETKDGTLWLASQSWDGDGDQIYLRRSAGGEWSPPEALTSGRGDYYRTAIAQDGAGKIWVVWSAQESANFDLRARSFDGKRWSAPERLTTAQGSDIFHALISDRSGNLYLAYQSARSGNFDIFLRIYDGKKWSDEVQVSSDPAHDWEPALAAARDGRVTIVWDTYAKGNYDVVSRTYERGNLGPIVPIAESGAFESRASAQYDRQGRLWIAWDEGDWNWGKDYANLIGEKGRGLLVRRQVRVAVLSNGKLREPAAPIFAAIPGGFRQVFQQPRLVLDEHDVPWVFFRYRVNLPRHVKGQIYRGMWRLGATGYQHGRWLPMIEFPEGYGRIDAPVSAIAARGQIEVAWVSDGRLWPAGFPRQQNLLLTAIPQARESTASELVAYTAPAENLAPPHPNEASDLTRVRDYRATVGGRNLRIARGDIHRHTDLSWDGNRDGSLNDAYRYAMDAAGFDFLGVCDHQAGESIPYHWWMIQKAVDLFTIPGRFAPLYSYERSLPWPNGHRNVVFPDRGRPVLEISGAEERGEEGAGKLYRYLRRLGGLATSHTSATGAGTDWRDSDRELEPIVELYQGYRNNYEEPSAPRHAPARQAARFAAGSVWSAWAKGIKLGVQSSSDHVSTHTSYAAVFIDRIERHAIFQGLKARRSFAATDNLIVDFRMGGHFMGEIFGARPPVPLKAYIRGTGALARVSLIKNNRIIYTAPGAGPEMNFTYTATDTEPGESYYYIRIEQQDGQLGWSSPVWVRY
ncbi:MAG: hypothetical protein HYZ57_12795 [Acidobacteria bacterium]|nr:hypothetical protein [Acidobacteriota bacterium]MBI3280708.1 hypothetical protein [Acidobacteriota bacterium]